VARSDEGNQRRPRVARIAIGTVVFVVVLVAAYDLVLWRVGYSQNAWCERTLPAGQGDDFWDATGAPGDRVDLSRSSDAMCSSCSITFRRAPRVLLPAVEYDRHVVQPCAG
jgi:hypothetical protein